MSSQLIEEHRSGAEVHVGHELCERKSREFMVELGLPDGLLPLPSLDEVGYNRPDPHLRLHRQAGVVRQGGDGVRGARADARPRRGEEQGAPHLGHHLRDRPQPLRHQDRVPHPRGARPRLPCHRLPARARGGGGGPQGGGRGRRRRRRQLICSSFRRRRPCVGCSIR
uniref:Uncharacterized protein n=1 Tax=Zea mays TaxID=4577 RepID=C4JBW5_MAIZE|nr:unknown [Zea mays]